MSQSRLAILAASATLAGCGSLSGYDANTQFACKAPTGVHCESMSGVYANMAQRNLPAAAPADLSRAKEEGVLSKPIYSGTPIRSAPRVLRVWFSPWEDSDGDLHDQNYVYLQVDNGRWLIEHNRRRIQDAYRPVRAPSTLKASAPTGNGVPAVSSVSAGAAQGQEVINAIQGRPTGQDAADMMGAIRTPMQLGQPGAPSE